MQSRQQMPPAHRPMRLPHRRLQYFSPLQRRSMQSHQQMPPKPAQRPPRSPAGTRTHSTLRAAYPGSPYEHGPRSQSPAMRARSASHTSAPIPRRRGRVTRPCAHEESPHASRRAVRPRPRFRRPPDPTQPRPHRRLKRRCGRGQGRLRSPGSNSRGKPVSFQPLKGASPAFVQPRRPRRLPPLLRRLSSDRTIAPTLAPW